MSTEIRSPSGEPPLGLRLFPPTMERRRRRLRLVYGVLVMAVAAGLVWPVYPWMAGIRPLILGLPLSLAWVVGAVLVVFGATAIFFRLDSRWQASGEAGPDTSAGVSPGEDHG